MELAPYKALLWILSLCKLGNDQSYEFKGLEDPFFMQVRK